MGDIVFFRGLMDSLQIPFTDSSHSVFYCYVVVWPSCLCPSQFAFLLPGLKCVLSH